MLWKKTKNRSSINFRLIEQNENTKYGVCVRLWPPADSTIQQLNKISKLKIYLTVRVRFNWNAQKKNQKNYL